MEPAAKRATQFHKLIATPPDDQKQFDTGDEYQKLARYISNYREGRQKSVASISSDDDAVKKTDVFSYLRRPRRGSRCFATLFSISHDGSGAPGLSPRNIVERSKTLPARDDECFITEYDAAKWPGKTWIYLLWWWSFMEYELKWERRGRRVAI
ncbi:MAG: hypothetical protein Q9197_004049 [Variospora fuerteventurae]